MNNTKKLALDGMCTAMCTVLGYIAIDTGSVKVTFESLPILAGAFLFGPVDGLAIGTVGTLLYQLLRYGVSATTPLWILPYTLCGLAAGLCAQRADLSRARRALTATMVGCELLVTLCNTIALYVDSQLYGYYFPGFITGSLALRLVLCIVKALAFSAVLPRLLHAVRKELH